VKRVAIYARYSTDKQDATTLEGQRRVAEKHAEERGLVVVGFYTDAAISGSSMRRPGLQELLADARAKRFDTVIVPDLSRLSRNSTDAGLLRRQLDDVGVNILDVETGTDSEDDSADMVFALKGIISQEQIKTISKHTHRQLESRAKEGHHTGGKAYGFSSVSEPTADPDRPRRKLVIAEREAVIVRRIFDAFVTGQSPREIAGWLNTEKIAAPHDGGKGNKSGKGWGFTTVRAMLLNRRYIGDVIWNATRWKKNSDGQRHPIPRAEGERIVHSNPELAIITADVWQRAQARFTLTGRRERPGRPPGSVKQTFILAGLLRCGVCGGTFGTAFTKRRKDGRTVRRLGCMANKSRGAAICSNDQIVPETKVTDAIIEQVRKTLQRPDAVKVFMAGYAEKLRELETNVERPRRELEKAIAQEEELLGRIEQAIIAAPTSKGLPVHLATAEARITTLRAELADLAVARPRLHIHPAAVKLKIEELGALMRQDDLTEAGALLRKLLHPFAMHPEPGGAYRMIGALDFNGLTRTEKRVAGACYEGFSTLVTPIEAWAGGDARR
jgi:DNA invertase Pin-like site-specific DNA recombinase